MQITDHTETGRKRRVLRGPDDGNLLWKLYKELGETRRRAFLAHLAANGVDYWQFSADSRASLEVAGLSVARWAVYEAFFGDDLAAAYPHAQAA